MKTTTTNSPGRAEFSELASARQTHYGLLAATFSEPPNTELLNAVSGGPFLSEMNELFGQEALVAFQACSENAGSKEWENQTRQEFMNLFKVPGPKYVRPYEAVYRDTREINGEPVKGLLAGQSTIDVQKWYRLAALDISEDFKDLPDHISIELGYMACLCQNEQEFANQGDEARLHRTWEMQRDFLAGHLLKWTEDLCKKILDKTSNTYFRAIATLTPRFLAQDLALLEEIAGPSSGASAPQYEKDAAPAGS